MPKPFLTLRGRIGRPLAYATLRGNADHPALWGEVYFFSVREGTLVVVEATGLPKHEGTCGGSFFGFHIHEGATCGGSEPDPFADSGAHFNPAGCAHPYHKGDLPPLVGAGGYAFGAFVTDRFTAGEVVGRTVIIHDAPDDFTTQPSGDAGHKMACGEIVRY